MVKVFNEHDKWSLISLSNNSGKNLELKFVSSLRRQFEFSVDSFQIILDRLLESYMQEESQHKNNTVEKAAENQKEDSPSLQKQDTMAETDNSTSRDLSSKEAAQTPRDEMHEKESQTDLLQQIEHATQKQQSTVETDKQEKTPGGLKEASGQRENSDETDISEQTSLNVLSEKKETSEKTEPPTQIELRHEPELLDKTKCVVKSEDGHQAAHSNCKELCLQNEPSNHTNPVCEEKDLTEQMEQPESAKASNKTLTEPLNLAEESHSTEQPDITEYHSEGQGSNEKDKTQPICAPEPNTPLHANIEVELADERNVETVAVEQIQAEREKDMESEMTEEISASEAKNTQGIHCSCSTFTVPLTLTGTQDTQETNSTLHTDSSENSPNTLDAVSPPHTQDILPAPPSLASDKKTSSPSCKASERLSHMVVLKHSSPKPPRRMCRKVTPSPVVEGKPVIVSCLDPNPCPSPEPEIASKPEAPSSDPATTPTAMVLSKSEPEPEPKPSSNLSPNLDLTSAPNPDPAMISNSAIDPMPALPQELSSSQLVTQGSCKTSIQSLKETSPTHVASQGQSQSSSRELVSAPKQSEPVASADTLISQTDTSSSDIQDPAHTSQVELSDDESREPWTKKINLIQANDIPPETTPTSASSPHCVTPPVSCLTPPILSLSPPCFTPSPPSLSPPPCLTPPSHCLASAMLSSVSPATSFSSPPLSFSPTSSCVSSPPYLTPPMLSLSPPPLCLTPPSPCLSPPLVCLTTPVESEGHVSQVSSNMEPLILNTDSEEQIKETPAQPGVPLLQLEDKNEQDFISSLPLVAEPVSFPITIPSSTSCVVSHSQAEGPRESAPPRADAASSSVPENKETLKVTADAPKQCTAPRASSSVPDVEVLAESMYGDFEAAMDHLRYRLIATRNPEEIRGGGLLKYSNLLVRDYRPASETQIKTLERYMCSRFFIDFPDVQEQQRKILSYLKNHFIGEERSKYQYLMTLRRVVDDSTVCLMGHERRQTLNMITVLALKVLGEQNIIPNTDHVTCFYQPAPYLAEHSAPYLAEPSYCSYYIPQGGSTLLYQPYPLHLHSQTGLV